jgi:small subunit ribosomal protein S7
MARSGRIKKRALEVDPIYGNRLIARITNRVMKDGKKSIAMAAVYGAIEIVVEKTQKETEFSQKDPAELVRLALENIKPVMEVRSRRIGGAAYQVPMPVKGDRREALSIRWLVESARKRPNKEFNTFAEKLAAELYDALRREGLSVKKRNDTHKAAESNKAFAHFRW